MEATKNVPPTFIIESCVILASGSSIGQQQILPDMLRRVRMGEAEETDLELIVNYVVSATNVDERLLLSFMRQHPSSVAFMALCWCMIRQSKWNLLSNARMNDMAYLSYPHLQFGSPVGWSVRPSGHTATSLTLSSTSTLHMEVLAMQYRTLVQLLYKYKQMDMSRVNIMKDITGMIQEIFRNDPESSTSTSAKDKTVSNPYTIGASSMNRLLENLWKSAELISPVLTLTAATPKSSKASKAPKAGRQLHTESGVETLRVEFDALKEVYSSAEQCTASEVSFLKWASGGITPQHQFNTTVPGTMKTHATSRPSTANPTNILPPSPSISTLPPTPHKSLIKPTAEGEMLGKFVFDSTPVMGELEECMLELLDCGGLLYEDLCDISRSVDYSLAGLGLTVEDIDAYCADLHSSEQGSAEESVNLFDYLDSNSRMRPTESSDILHRHIQQQYIVPVVSSETELHNLRQLHGHTMRRTANACAKHSPFEIVWRADKDIAATK